MSFVQSLKACCCSCFTPEPDPEPPHIPINQVRNPGGENGPQTLAAPAPAPPPAPPAPAPTPPPPPVTPVVQAPHTPVVQHFREYQCLYPHPNPDPSPPSPPSSPSPPPPSEPTAAELGMTEKEYEESKKKTLQAMQQIESNSHPTNPRHRLPSGATALGFTSSKEWEDTKKTDQQARKDLARRRPVTRSSSPPPPDDENTPFLARSPSPTPSAPQPPSPSPPSSPPPCARALFSYNPDHQDK